MTDLSPGSVVWVDLDPAADREQPEQRGRRPAVVIASRGYLRAVPELVIVVPATTRDRSWPHHVRLTGAGLTLRKPSWAMTEQPRAISRHRIAGDAGNVDDACMQNLARWLDDFLYRPGIVT